MNRFMREAFKGFRGPFAVALVLTATLPAVTLAQDDEGAYVAPAAQPVIPGTPWYVSPMVSTMLPDSTRGLEQGYGASIAIGKKLLDGLAVELSGAYTALDATAGNSSAKLMNTGVSALVFPSTNFPWVYGLLGAHYGAGKDLPSALGNYNSFVLETGVGLLYPVNFFKRFLLRADVRFRLDSPDSKDAGTSGTENAAFYDDVFSIGALFPLGPPPAAPVAKAAEATAPADSDNDGVLDAADRCPGTPAGAVVDEFGCEKDSDGDGVPDRLDQCPDTPQGMQVNESGCPLDSDGDGVPDASDDCPNTPAGAKVLPNGCTLRADCRKPRANEKADENGCAIEQRHLLRGVKYDFDSDRLTPSAKDILRDIAATLKEYPELQVELQGHTCSMGPDEYNQRLSERRARSAKRYLVEQGVAEGRMTTAGYGESQPMDTNDTEAGRENNRRTELKVLNDPGAVSAEAAEAAATAADALTPASAEAAPADAEAITQPPEH